MKHLDELDRMIAALPDEMEIKEVLVPMKVRDPKDPRKMIDDPHGRIQQRRMDIFDKADPQRVPIIHFHTLPDHPTYFGENWSEIANVFVNMKANLKLLKQFLEEKQNVNRME